MSESFSRFVEQLEAVLDSNPRDVLQFAIELRDSGVAKDELTLVFDAVRSRHLTIKIVPNAMQFSTRWT